ncbi:hypothetical protein GCM10010109_56810 [Actinoplanes campanulatus]|nr:hypothetical protein GCM10010109_56810 [Actinoplanes campanulatus]GID38667.1 hypothetical protein Aca09nite_51730 [Actinoplanes campanulatus]
MLTVPLRVVHRGLPSLPSRADRVGMNTAVARFGFKPTRTVSVVVLNGLVATGPARKSHRGRNAVTGRVWDRFYGADRR